MNAANINEGSAKDSSTDCPLLGMAFINANDDPMWVPRWEHETAQVFDLVRSLLRERVPAALHKGSNAHGTFKWSLPDDVLEHRHVQFGL